MIDVGVLTVVSLLLVAMVVRAVVRLVAGRASSRTLAVVALVWWTVLAVPAVATEVQHHRTEAAATSATRLVSGDPTSRAVCERWTANLINTSSFSGFVSWDSPDVAQLRSGTCADLASWLRSDRRHPTQGQVVALHVVAHEAVHVGGERSEAATECQAMAWDARVAEHLGAPPDVARQMAETYRRDVYPRMPEEYRGDCDLLVERG